MNNPVPVLPPKIYDFLKWVALVVLPAGATGYIALSGPLHLPNADGVSAAIIAVDTFLGAILNLSSKAYNSSEDRFAGDAVVEGTGDDKKVSFAFNEHPADLVNGKDELTFRVTRKKAAPAKRPAKKTARAKSGNDAEVS